MTRGHALAEATAQTAPTAIGADQQSPLKNGNAPFERALPLPVKRHEPLAAPCSPTAAFFFLRLSMICPPRLKAPLNLEKQLVIANPSRIGRFQELIDENIERRIAAKPPPAEPLRLQKVPEPRLSLDEPVPLEILLYALATVLKLTFCFTATSRTDGNRSPSASCPDRDAVDDAIADLYPYRDMCGSVDDNVGHGTALTRKQFPLL